MIVTVVLAIAAFVVIVVFPASVLLVAMAIGALVGAAVGGAIGEYSVLLRADHFGKAFLMVHFMEP